MSNTAPPGTAWLGIGLRPEPVQPVQHSQSVPGYSMFSVDQATTGTSLGPSGRFVVPPALTRSANWEQRQAEPRYGLRLTGETFLVLVVTVSRPAVSIALG